MFSLPIRFFKASLFDPWPKQDIDVCLDYLFYPFGLVVIQVPGFFQVYLVSNDFLMSLKRPYNRVRPY